MREVTFSKDVIRDDKTPFSLDGKIEPNFFNAGNTIVNIESIPISPGAPFSAGVTEAITKGNVDIIFENEKYDTNKPLVKKLVCFYGVLVSEDHNEKAKSDCN